MKGQGVRRLGTCVHMGLPSEEMRYTTYGMLGRELAAPYLVNIEQLDQICLRAFSTQET